MFEVLIGSAVARRSGGSRGVVVAALHGVVIAVAVRATTQPPSIPAPPRVVTIPFILPTPRPQLPVVSSGSSGAIEAPMVELPPVPLTAPTGIPPVTIGPAVVPLRQWGVPLPDPVASGDPRGAATPWTEAEVDQPAAPIHQPSPRYPPVLREAGIEGRVLLEFVIDTTGRVEESSLRVVERSASGFDAAAIESLARSLFTPARVKGTAVRQRARQSIAFRIRPE